VPRVEVAVLHYQGGLERDKESRAARVTLAARAAPQLIVNAPALVPVGANYVQATKCSYSLTKPDIGASPRHVRRDGHRPPLSALGNNGRFQFVIARVQHAVGHVR